MLATPYSRDLNHESGDWHMRKWVSRAGCVALALAMTASVVACGSKGGGAKPAASLAGPRVGQTIKIGYTNDEGGAFSPPEFRIGGEVAVHHINAHGGGGGGQNRIHEGRREAPARGPSRSANQG